MFELLFWPALFALALGFNFIVSGSDDAESESEDPGPEDPEVPDTGEEDPTDEEAPTDNPNSETLPVATQGDDTLTVTATMRGSLDAGDGDDTITVAAGVAEPLITITPLDHTWDTQDGDPPLSVLGGAGDDVITLAGQGVVVTTGTGADSVTINGLQNALIHAEAEDTIYGQDSDDLPSGPTDANVRIVIDGAGTFLGGSSNDSVTTTGDGATVLGGAGDDVIYDFGGSVSVMGGAGNDTIQSDISRLAFAPSATDRLSFYTGADSDTLDGGAGNDQLAASHGDRLTGGDGDDHFVLYLDDNVTAPASIVTDFAPQSEQIVIYYGSAIIPQDPAETGLANSITTRVTLGGTTEILGDGNVIAVIEGQATLRIGIGTLLGGEGPVTGLDGVSGAFEDFDVVIQRFQQT